MNEKVIHHKELCDGLNALYARKNHDYGDSFHQTFVEEGLAMSRIRLGDKFSRFKTLSRISPTDSDQHTETAMLKSPRSRLKNCGLERCCAMWTSMASLSD